ncbi:unnamed protein product, partial [Sphacelaria rigidula]
MKIRSLERNIRVAREWPKRQRDAKRNYQKQADRCKSKIMRAQRSSEEEEAHQPVPLPPPTGGHATRSEEEERLVQEIVLR